MIKVVLVFICIAYCYAIPLHHSSNVLTAEDELELPDNSKSFDWEYFFNVETKRYYVCEFNDWLVWDCPGFNEHICDNNTYYRSEHYDFLIPSKRDHYCICDSVCWIKVMVSTIGSIAGISFFVVIGCFIGRRQHKRSTKKIEEALNKEYLEKHHMVHKQRFNSFRWIPFTVMTAIAVWFFLHTVYTIVNFQSGISIENLAIFIYLTISSTFMLFFLGSTLCLFTNACHGLMLMGRALKSPPPKHTDTVQHVVVLPNYYEDEAMIIASIMRLAKQKGITVKRNVTVVLAMESNEKEHEKKAERIKKQVKLYFKDVITTVHTFEAGEQRGKSSNCVSAFRQLHENNHITEPHRTMCTLMDADALPHENFLASLSAKFEQAEKRKVPNQHVLFWQCPVAFYQNLDEVDFINRASAIIMAFNEVANAGGFVDFGLFGYNPRMPVNTYTMSWRLWKRMEGGDPFVVADEGHNLIKAFYRTNGFTKIEPIYLPISVYSITSDKFFDGFKNRFKQITRWMYGNSYGFAFWFGRFSESTNGIPLSVYSPILWRLFIFSSVNLVQPLFFCLYGFLWAFTIGHPFYQSVSIALVTVIMTTFLILNVAMSLMHWRLVYLLKIEGIMEWPWWKKFFITLWDAVIGVGASTVFFIFAAGFKANWDLLVGAGLDWGTEGRAKKVDDHAPTPPHPLKKDFSKRTLLAAKDRMDKPAKPNLDDIVEI